MPQFNVVAREVQFYLCQVEADDEDHARELASELDAREFEYLDGGDWEIVNVEEIHVPAKKRQQSLFGG